MTVPWYLPLTSLLTCGLLTAGLNSLALRGWRRTAGGHWTERARVLWPVRKTAAAQVLMIPLIFAGLEIALLNASLNDALVLTIAGLVGSIAGTWPMDHEILRGLAFRIWLHSVIAAWTLGMGRTVLFLGVMLTMPPDFGTRTWATFGVCAVVFLVWSNLSRRALRWMRILRPSSERLQRIVDDCSQRQGIPVKRVWQMRGAAANAVALPLLGELIFTDRLMDTATDEEVAVICAHELGHLSESKATIALRSFSPLIGVPSLLIVPASHQFGFWGIGCILLTQLVLIKLHRRLSLQMEKRADHLARNQEMNEGFYARTLAKLYELNQTPAVTKGRNLTHPHLYDRMVTAGVTPDFPRPQPAVNRNLQGWALLVIFGFSIGAGSAQYFKRAWSSPQPSLPSEEVVDDDAK